MLGDGGSYLVKGLSLGDLRQFPRRLRGGVVGVCFERRLKAAVKLVSSRGSGWVFSLGGKGVPGTGECGGDSFIHMGRGHGAQQLAAHKGQQFLLPPRPARQSLSAQIPSSGQWRGGRSRFLLFSTRPNCGDRSSPVAKGSSGHRPDTRLSAVGSISSVKY